MNIHDISAGGDDHQLRDALQLAADVPQVILVLPGPEIVEKGG